MRLEMHGRTISKAKIACDHVNQVTITLFEPDTNESHQFCEHAISR